MAASKGVRVNQWDLDPDLFRRFPIALPSREEQDEIAYYLDRETARIDALIEKKTRFIELLREKQQALITQALTRGLDPSVPMKDSGVEWLGQVPSHWEVGRLGRHINVLNGFAFPSEKFSFDETDCRLLRGVNVNPREIRWDDAVFWHRESNDGLEKFSLRAGDIVVGLDRTWISTGTRVARISEKDLPCLLLQRVAAIRPHSSIADEFLLHLLGSEMLKFALFADQTGLSVPHISSGQIERFAVALPTLEEQERICSALRQALRSLDRLSDTTDRSVQFLQERRAALITAAVTGQIDVREAA
jgi:type I restriction enzyme S subunit